MRLIPAGVSVRARLTVLVAAIAGAVAVSAAVLAPGVIERVLVDDSLDAEAAASARSLDDELGLLDVLGAFGGLDDLLGSAAGRIVTDLDRRGIGDELRDRSTDGSVVVALGADAFVVVDRDGQVTVTADRPTGAVVAVDELIELSNEVSGSGVVLTDVLLGELSLGPLFGDEPVVPSPASGTAARLEAEDLAFGVREVDGAEFVVAAPVDDVRRSIDRVQTVLWWAVPVVVGVSALVTWLLASRALRPVRGITDRAAGIHGAGALHERVPVPDTGDEIAALAVTINEMLERLERDDTRRRRFVSDASHELRSPVAVLRTTAEVALARPEGADVVELASGVVVEADRMSAIITDLLALARHDEELPPPGLPVDLDDIVLTEAARARRVPVDASRVSAGRVLGRRDELARLVAHLLDNAARHATSRVEVGLRTSDGRAVLTVDDDGPGIPADRRDDVFERFVRLDDARTRDAGGAGLGLAVVAATARACGGSVGVLDAPIGGARVQVDLPAAE